MRSDFSIADKDLELRPANVVMDLRRLGTFYQYPLSFMRILMRKIMREQWQIRRTRFDLNEDGYGTTVYTINTHSAIYSFVVFAHQIAEHNRSDRVIADQWDMTVTLCEGHVNQERLTQLQQNVPKQEEGRLDSTCLVMSRANRSSRNFNYVIETLSAGAQPSLAKLAEVGYLYRTTAVYGSGKFGMADWQKVIARYPDFAQPFAAEMFTCYMIRQFSFEQADHIARHRAPETATALCDTAKRYIGIGNATGLGMAPYLIRHPLLINHWIEIRETALATVFRDAVMNDENFLKFQQLLNRAIQHLSEISINNEAQNAQNRQSCEELKQLRLWCEQHPNIPAGWATVSDYVFKRYAVETQEIIHSVLMELFAELIVHLENVTPVGEQYEFEPEMSIFDLKKLITRNYQWALNYDFSNHNAEAVFWYRSEEKMEPRLGQRGRDAGCELEINIGIARLVYHCYQALCAESLTLSKQNVAQFVFKYPQFRQIIRRIHAMTRTRYGEIHSNLLAIDVLPIELLRCKLSFFGVGKFDPKSRLWVRNTMFQGAPVVSDIGQPFSDDWYFPVMPSVYDMARGETH